MTNCPNCARLRERIAMLEDINRHLSERINATRPAWYDELYGLTVTAEYRKLSCVGNESGGANVEIKEASSE